MEHNKKHHRSTSKSPGIFFGGILLLVGILFLAFNFGLIDSALRSVLFSWPMIFIVLGLFSLYRKEWGGAFFGLIFGGFFLLPIINRAYPGSLPFMSDNFSANYWPLLLILLGLAIIIRFALNKNKNHHQSMNREFIEGTDGYYHRKVLFGGNEDIFLEPVFTGGEIEAIFGGVSVDFRKSSLPEGETYLNVQVIFGGVELFLPEGWIINTKINSIMGGVENKRFTNIESQDGTKKLIITGDVIFGGCEIR